MCGHFFDHGIGKVLAQVAPIAAAFIPGVGPLASAALAAGTAGLSAKLQGGSWGDALKSGAISGLTAGAIPIAGNALSSLAPETMASLGINGGYNTVFGQNFGNIGPASALSQASMAGLDPSNVDMQSPSSAGASMMGNSGASMPFATDPYSAEANGMSPTTSSALQTADPSLSGSSGGTGLSSLASKVPVVGPVMGKAAEWATDHPLPLLMGAGTLYSGLKTAQDRTKQQQQQQAAMNAKNAQDLANWKLTLNTPPLNRQQSPNNANIDYNKYGFGPEQQFLTNNQTSPSNYMASGGKVRALGYKAGGFPRKNGKIAGPGGPTGDKIKAMLSDGEYVIKAKSVSGLGQGSNSTGAKILDKLNNAPAAKLKALGGKIHKLKGAA